MFACLYWKENNLKLSDKMGLIFKRNDKIEFDTRILTMYVTTLEKLLETYRSYFEVNEDFIHLQACSFPVMYFETILICGFGLQ
jgi:transposase